MTDEERTIAFADLSGFTALTEAHGDEIGTAIALRFYDMTRSLLRNGAVLVKTIGDAVMIATPDPATAVEIVLELQTLTDSTPNFPMIRAGVHVGPAREANHDYFGAAVNLAARVAAYARSGQILCTAAVASRVAECSLYTLVHIGPVSLRNVHDPVVLYEVRNRAIVATAAHTDPICRMHVSADAAFARVKSGTVEYCFCSFACLRAFVLEFPLSEDHSA